MVFKEPLLNGFFVEPKDGSSMASLERTFWSTFIFKK